MEFKISVKLDTFDDINMLEYAVIRELIKQDMTSYKQVKPSNMTSFVTTEVGDVDGLSYTTINVESYIVDILIKYKFNVKHELDGKVRIQYCDEEVVFDNIREGVYKMFLFASSIKNICSFDETYIEFSSDEITRLGYYIV